MALPLVTIAIPAYKAEFIQDTIKSALSQTYRNIEILIVDDSSNDEISSIVKRINDNRICYVKNDTNIGGVNPAYNWNRCLELAKGEFFCLLCDDDLYEPNFVETLFLLAEKYPKTNVFRSRANFINSEGIEINRFASAPECESWEDYLWHVAHGYRTQTISEWMYRISALRACGGFALLPLAWYADYLTIFRVAKDGGIVSFAYINFDTFEKYLKD